MGRRGQTFNQILSLRTLLQSFLQAICHFLTLELVGCCLEGSVSCQLLSFTPLFLSSLSPLLFPNSDKTNPRMENRMGKDIRRSISIQQNMPIAQLLRIRPVLQVLLQTVLPNMRRLADGADGRLVDDRCAVCFFCHVAFRLLYLCFFFICNWEIGG
jgi:hypothetical protein